MKIEIDDDQERGNSTTPETRIELPLAARKVRVDSLISTEGTKDSFMIVTSLPVSIKQGYLRPLSWAWMVKAPLIVDIPVEFASTLEPEINLFSTCFVFIILLVRTFRQNMISLTTSKTFYLFLGK